jgi:vesicle-associated membrane protein 7
MGKIQYAVVARGAVVLAEHGGAGGTASNAGAVARQILERLNASGGADDCHVSYTQGLYVFHVRRTDGLTALCMTDDAAGSKYYALHCTRSPPVNRSSPLRLFSD